MNKKGTIIAFIVVLLVIVSAVVTAVVLNKKDTKTETTYLKTLPKPEISGGARGELGIDKNINEATIDEYLNRPDSVYRDMRMLEDPGNYESIGGDRYLSGYVEGFEVVPLPYIIPVTGLPESVGETYTGTTLFYNDNGTYIANFEESLKIIETLFPKDKNIFLMCGGGGYSGMMKTFLVSMGWDENKIYNTGGFWYYEGKHRIDVKKEVNGKTTYDFDKVPYHNIDFDTLTKTSSFLNPNIKVSEIKLNTDKIELEEGTSFQLSAIVLPNDAANKEIKWTSSDESVAKVTTEGLVKAVHEGKATIKVQAVLGEKEDVSASCEISVTAPEVVEKLKLDDVSEAKRIVEEHNPDKIMQEYYDWVYDENFETKEKYRDYYDPNDNTVYKNNEEAIQEFQNHYRLAQEANKERTKVINKLIDEKKSFIILYHVETCEERPYSIYEKAPKLLKKNNYDYLDLGGEYGYNDSVYNSKLNQNKIGDGSIIIVKDGEIYGSIDFEKLSIKDEEEFKNWLNKYIDIE